MNGGRREVRVEGHRLIRAPLQRVWQLLSRLESYPRYASLWLTADLLERSQTSALVEFRGFFGGLPVTSVQRVVMRPPGRIEFRQVRGTLRALSGTCTLRDVEGETELTVQMAADAGIVFFSEASVQQILVAHIDRMLTKIKASAERDLVRATVRRSPASGEAGTAAAALSARVGAALAPEDEEEAGPGQEGEPPAPDGPPSVMAGEPPRSATLPAPAPGGRRRRRRRRRRGRPPAGGGEPQGS
ncbi:MAG: SRPBCC family protein [Armatimonadota bacterium]|nr:SRPBCC family protein [Armatimonadota bacterium]MDR7519644.1 SRPBCC family protein [Armatimonadota bacterium]MDR7551104.1 SRPBCC family protein [Armatimonadota bacterium]